MTEVPTMRPLIFGEVLFDHFPDGTTVLGGAPFNVAWHLHAFGLKPLMISRVGDDERGRLVKTAMQNWGMECCGLQTDAVHPTGTVQVQFIEGEPSYEIVDKVAYDFIQADELPALNGPWLLYHGSLALRHETSTAALSALKKNGESPVFVDINLRRPWWNKDQVLGLIEGASWIKLNTAELGEIYPQTHDQEERVQNLAKRISQQIILTGGEQGATALSTTNNRRVSVVPETASTVIDTVGAGDSFCSVLVAGQLLGWPLEVAMKRAQAFASAIVGIRGAITQDLDFYRHFTRDWDLKDIADV